MCRNSVKKVTQSYRGMVMSYTNDNRIHLRGEINLPPDRRGENEDTKQAKIQNLRVQKKWKQRQEGHLCEDREAWTWHSPSDENVNG